MATGMVVKEWTVESALVRAAETHGGECHKMVSPNVRGRLDQVVLLPGGVVGFVECKRPVGGQLSTLQVKEIERLKRLGMRVAVVTTVAEAVGTIDDWAYEGRALLKIAKRLIPQVPA